MLFHRGVEEGNDEIHLRTQTSTDDQGHYHFAHLFSGTFFIVVSAQPWYAHTSPTGPETDPLNVTYPLTYFSGSTEAGGATPISVKPGDKNNRRPLPDGGSGDPTGGHPLDEAELRLCAKCDAQGFRQLLRQRLQPVRKRGRWQNVHDRAGSRRS